MIALVTGGNRGIGLEVCRQLARSGHEVILGARDRAKGERVANGLRVVELDVADDASVQRAAAEIDALDVLVNNAAILYDTWARASTADLDEVHAALETNLFGAWRTTLAFLPQLRQSAHPRVVNVSSESGSLSGMSGGTPAYSVSKAALNALTRMLAQELATTHPRQRGLPRLDGHGHGPGWPTRRAGRGERRVGGRAWRRRPDRRLLP